MVLGNEHVRPGLVNRELLIHDGEPISQSAVLESQRRLYDLGIFNQVQITPQEEPASDTEKTLLVGLEESRRWVLGYGGGFEVQKLGSNQPQGQYKESPRLSLNLTRLDVGGRGQTFSMGGRLSNIDTGANMGYLIPRLFNRDDLSLRINGLVDRSRDVLTFTADRKEASVSVEKRFSASTLLIGQYSFRRVEALDISSKISAQEIPLLSQPALVGMVGGSFVEDHRDDPVGRNPRHLHACGRGSFLAGLWIAGKLLALHRAELHLLCLGLPLCICAQNAVRRDFSLWKPVLHYRARQQRPARRGHPHGLNSLAGTLLYGWQ